MARYRDIGDQMADLDIEDEENESFVFEGDVEEDGNRYDLCLVGRFLTEKTINLRAMKSKLADVWKPMMGINIKELEQGIYLFQFYHQDDMQWVSNGGPWMFDNAMMILEKVAPGEDPLQVQLWHLNIWIQLHDLPMGFMSETVGQQLGNFFGEFVQYDAKNNSSIWREYMRIKIRLDVRKPLKRKKKIVKKDGKEIIVNCKYERLGDFCFSCGMVTHTDRFCRKFLGKRETEIEKEWGSWLRAPPRRAAGQGQSRWLREEGDDTWEARIGKQNRYRNYRDDNDLKNGKEIIQESESRGLVVTEPRNHSNNNSLAGFSTISNVLYGPDVDENTGLKYEERKRRRGDPTPAGEMDIDLGPNGTRNQAFGKQTEPVISSMDLADSSQTVPAKSAMQTSRLQ